MLVELKNGETLNGHLVNCDTWMNLTLKEVVQTSPEGDRFFRLAEVYVRGNNVCIIHPPAISRNVRLTILIDQISSGA
jgi:U6 snRNA-associated Sm-like protein LSm4